MFFATKLLTLPYFIFLINFWTTYIMFFTSVFTYLIYLYTTYIMFNFSFSTTYLRGLYLPYFNLDAFPYRNLISFSSISFSVFLFPHRVYPLSYLCLFLFLSSFVYIFFMFVKKKKNIVHVIYIIKRLNFVNFRIKSLPRHLPRDISTTNCK